MYFDSINELIAMAGHGVYVWSAYLISVLAIAVLLVAPIMQHRSALKRVVQQQSISKPADNSLAGDI